MIFDLEDYIESHISPQPHELEQIDRETNLRYVNGRMCSGHIQGRLLKMITRMIRPRRVLELGTFTGYSALCVAEALEEGARIDTIEADDEMETQILENISLSPHAPKVKLHIGDALEVMEQWSEPEFDLILIDADKRQYADYFRKAIKILKPGGFIIADNTLWDGHVVEQGRHSSQTRGIIEFNDLVASAPGIETSIIPMRDGLTLIYKTPDYKNLQGVEKP